MMDCRRELRTNTGPRGALSKTQDMPYFQEPDCYVGVGFSITLLLPRGKKPGAGRRDLRPEPLSLGPGSIGLDLQEARPGLCLR